MLCPFCFEQSDDGETRLPCIATKLPIPERIDRILVKTGHWECDQCGWTKPIYEKQPTTESRDELIKSISCHCCNDTGSIHHHLVQDFIFPDYKGTDPPIPCKRCQRGLKVSGWDIATKADCDRIHTLQLSKIKFSECPEKVDLKQKVISLSQKMSLKSKP